MTKLYFILHICKVTTKWLRESRLSKRARTQSIETLNFSCRLSRIASSPTRWYAPASRASDRARMSPSSSSTARRDDATSIDVDLVRRRQASRELVSRRIVSFFEGKSRPRKEYQRTERQEKEEESRKRTKGIAGKKDTEDTWGG